MSYIYDFAIYIYMRFCRGLYTWFPKG